MGHEARIIDDLEGIDRLLAATKRIAVLGMKTAEQADQPAFQVPQYMQEAGYEIVPVPVYFPEATEILGQRVHRKLVDVPGDIDLVDVFRRAKDLEGHVEDILAKRPRAVWLQLGIRSEPFVRKMVTAGIDVVQDRCLMVEHRRWVRARR